MIRFIPSRVHGVLDYSVSLLLVFAPRLFGFQTGGPEEKVPMILGVSGIVYSLITRYELGLFKVVPFRLHLAFDFLFGLILATSPWVYGFADRVWAPHVTFGIVAIAAAAFTRPQVELAEAGKFGR